MVLEWLVNFINRTGCRLRRLSDFSLRRAGVCYQSGYANNRLTVSLLGLVMVAGMIATVTGCNPSGAPLTPPQERLRVATTTSLYDTGLWGYLEPRFEELYSVELDVIYAGTGKALEYGRRGDVDVITVHSKAREEQFVAEGYGLTRIPFAYNYFLIVGPEIDPAGIKGLSSVDAFRKLKSTARYGFVSRGDDSGTHSKEKNIWESAGYDYETVRNAGDWYLESGSGMGPTLRMASEKQAYTLTDMGTFLAYQGNLELRLIINNDSMLLNVYSVIAVNPEKVAGIDNVMASDLITFLISPETQGVIGSYGVAEYGRQLFTPGAAAVPE